MDLQGLDFERLASEVIRELRGPHSQSWLSRRGGYRSNIAHRWEAGSCYPTAARFLTLCGRLKRPVLRCLAAFFQQCPTWLEANSVPTPQTVALFLETLRGKTPLLEVARLAEVNRYTVSRWCKGTAEPKLPDFLKMIEVTSHRLLDFLETLVDPSALASVKAAWKRLCAARSIAYDVPWSLAVLRALELDEVHRGGTPRLAAVLGLPESEVLSSLRVLKDVGQVRRLRGHWRPVGLQKVDTRRDPVRARRLTATWVTVATDRLERGGPGTFGYSLFAVSRSDLKRLRDVHLEYVRAMQSIIAESRPSECVGLYAVQLLDLNPGPDNALGETG
jgi:hypothetical protein